MGTSGAKGSAGALRNDSSNMVEMKEGEAMRNGRIGVAEDEQAPSDAVEWFVSNTCYQELDPELVFRWEGWCNGPGHLEEYATVVELYRQLRTLPPPREAGKAELLRDVEGEVGGEDWRGAAVATLRHPAE